MIAMHTNACVMGSSDGKVRAMTHRVFVYGSLMSGLMNHGCLGGVPKLRDDSIPPSAGFVMVSLGAFPGVIPAHGDLATAIKGELYEVDDRGLGMLDRLEGHPNFYRREWVTLASGERAQAYVLQRHRSSCEIVTDGDWRAECEREEEAHALRRERWIDEEENAGTDYEF